MLAGIFSAIAVLLTAIGAYGVLSYAVAQRRREIGVRMALGARPEQIRMQFLSLSIRLLSAGTVLGFIGAWQAGRAMRSLLFQVPSLNIAVLVAAACVTAGVCSSPACCPRNAPREYPRWRLSPTTSDGVWRASLASSAIPNLRCAD